MMKYDKNDNTNMAQGPAYALFETIVLAVAASPFFFSSSAAGTKAVSVSS
jgi:hypothetical protein